MTMIRRPKVMPLVEQSAKRALKSGVGPLFVSGRVAFEGGC